ncbi:MAG TPA: polysaccharide deacetylase family protein [Candidatus Solibacter sp.]|nr:polysaccharide deacetylase family protein [Candidatus Solibacter sp.]
MPNHSLIYLMYHELEVARRTLCQQEQGYVRYVVREPDFRAQMAWLQTAGFKGISVSQALDVNARGIVLTFDDGCESDLAVAAPILQAASFGATFYITLGFLGRPGYLVASQVRELSDLGFDIGCHSMTHPYLDNLGDDELRREIADAKTELEAIIGRPVQHFSCPGGRWTPQVAEVAQHAGYRSVATSRVAANRAASDPYRLARIAVMRGSSLEDFRNFSAGRGLWQLQLRTFLQTASHQVLGNALYDRLRSFLLERRA